MAAKKLKTATHMATSGKAEPAAAPGRWYIWLLLVVTAIVFSGVTSHQLTFIDDDKYIITNPFLRDLSLKGIGAIFTSFYEFNYHPLTTLTWLLEYSLFGLNATVYHVVNLALHLANVWLVYRLAQRLSGKENVALMVAALFALHPLHVESIAWVSERKGLLSGLFYFMSLIAYVRYVDGSRRKDLLLCFVWFLFACASKSAAVTLPLVLMAIDWYRGRRVAASLLEKIPFLLVSILFGVLAVLSQKAGGSMTDLLPQYGLINRIFLFTGGLAFYFVKLAIPYPLSAIHFFPDVSGGALPWYFYASVPLLAAIGWGVWKMRSGARELRFGLLFFLAAMVVMLQLLPVGGAYAAERYTYVSYFGLFYAIVQWVDGAGFREVGHRVLAAVLLLFTFVSWARVGDWRDTDTILGDIVYKNEGNSRNSLVHYHWGQYYTYRQQWPEAADQYSRSLTIDQRNFPALLRRGEALDAMGRYKEAMADYTAARLIDAKSAVVYNNMGWTRFGLGDPAAALLLIDTAITLDSKLATAYNNRGWIKLQQKDSVAALSDFDAAIRMQPGFAKAYYNRALVKLYRGDATGAMADYTTIIRMYPNESLAWFNRGLVHLQLLDKQAAARDMHRAADLGNRNAASILTAELRGM